MTPKQNVIKCIRMKGPEYLPFVYVNQDLDQSDIIMIDVEKHFMGKDVKCSEWGFEWDNLDETMGQPKAAVVKSWDDLKHYQPPDWRDTSRFDMVAKTMAQYPDRFSIASLGLSGFTIMSFLRGFAKTLEELYLAEKSIEALADIVFGFEEKIITQLKGYGFDAVAFFDDWGTQNNLLISPQLWRTFFKPRYKKQFDLARQHGLYTYFHSCGNIASIVGDFVEIGLDMLNISQPNVNDVREIGRKYAGKLCFVCPISYQTTAISGSKQEIYTEAKRLLNSFWSRDGGFIAYIEAYECIGLGQDNYKNCIYAFNELSKME